MKPLSVLHLRWLLWSSLFCGALQQQCGGSHFDFQFGTERLNGMPECHGDFFDDTQEKHHKHGPSEFYGHLATVILLYVMYACILYYCIYIYIHTICMMIR